MKLRYQIVLLVALPVAALTALAAMEQRLAVPVLGREYVLRFPLLDNRDGVTLPQVSGPEGDAFPLVVIDAGHGGYDYGATGEGYREKDLVLGLAEDLENRLVEAGDIRVAMIRDSDRFVPLEDRLAITRELGADLFLSIHADSAGEAREVTGASIYTLSNSASSRAASRFAARENASGEVNGVELGRRSREVDDILVNLSRRRTQMDSAEFARLIERSGEDLIEFHPQVQRSAALVVLGSPDTPSVLFEAGFVTNARDAERLASDEGRARFSEAMARAIRAYFSRQLSSNGAGDS